MNFQQILQASRESFEADSSTGEAGCQLASSWSSPLYDSHGNSLNPCFISFITIAITSFSALLALYQTFQILLFNHHGPFQIKYSFGSIFKVKSVGIYNILKIHNVILQSVLFFVLTTLNFSSFHDVKSISLIFSFLVNILIILPLHALEPTRSIVGHASLLIHWSLSITLSLIVLVQDVFGPHKIYIPINGSSQAAAIAHTIEVILLLNSIIIVLLESVLYSPSVELVDYFALNEWDPSTVRNVFNEVLLLWVSPVIQLAYKNDHLEFEDIPQIDINLRADIALSDFSKYWVKTIAKAEEKTQKRLAKIENPTKADKEVKPSLYWTLIRANAGDVIISFVAACSDIGSSYAQPLLLQSLIVFFTQYTDASTSDLEKPPVVVGYSIAVSLFLLAVMRFVSFNRYYIITFFIGFKSQSFLSSMVYEKALRLSPEARKGRSSGDIVNNLSVDVNTVSSSPEMAIQMVVVPLRFVLCLLALYQVVGKAILGGLLISFVLLPLSTKMSTSINGLYNTSMKYKDERTSITSEILNAVKSIKLYSWEKPMLDRLDAIRNGKELVIAKRIGLFNAASTFLWTCIPFSISCSCFIAYALLIDVPLTPAVVFPALALFDLLNGPLWMLPDLFANLVECNVSLKRLRLLFQAEELNSAFVQRTYKPLKLQDISIDIKNANFVWNSNKDAINPETNDESNLALQNIDFTAKKGSLSCIVGKVGAGKTTLIKSILGEIPIDSTSFKTGNTKINVNGSTAYCSQSPWILNATIKENILFGKRYDKSFYQKTIEACQLTPDFEILADGDKTVVGEKGISLSGGQKARVSLARAVYARADVYLLDDVLSAVDAHVAKSIIQDVLGPQGLLATKTIVLATNAVSVLRYAKEIVFLKQGKIIERGTYDEVIAKKGELAALIEEYGQHDSKPKEESNDQQIETTTQVNHSSQGTSSSSSIHEFHPSIKPDLEDEVNALERVATHQTIGAGSMVSYGHNYDEDEDDEEDGKVRKTGHTEEKGEKGKIQLGVYLEYFKACSYSSLVLYLALYVANLAGSILGTYVLKYWSEKNANAHETLHPVFFLSIYAGIGVFGAGLSLLGSFVVWSYSVIRSSKYFHDKMARSVLRSPMSFFETTPIGRILNRFSEDINVIDQQIIWSILGFTDFAINALSLFAIIVYNLPAMFIVLLVLGLLYNHFRIYFVPSSRLLKRIRSAKKSPIFSHLQESVNGVETLRAYNQQDRFVHINRTNVNNLVRSSNINLMANRWLSMRLQNVSALIVFFSSLLIVTTVHTKNPLGPGLVGFIMSYVLNITTSLNAIVRFWADIESKSVSVERVIEYCNLKPEAEMVIEDNRPAAEWPSHGTIKFNNYSAKYRENLDPVLRNVTLDIKPAEKIGIVGRTGAGKSTLTLALFRIIEATEGNIDIDSIDTSKIGLYDLRYHLNIIPQDAHAFEGTVRENLDPFKDYTDAELWKVLELAHLKEHVESMKSEDPDADDDEDKKKKKVKKDDDETSGPAVGLLAKVSEGGSNLSSGQRQLLCLARALLKRSRVLILDEATAAVDVQTDKIIQETIRNEFSSRTIISIAHRIDTVMHSDRIIVLDKGQVKEFDSPQKLLSDKSSIFYSLCKKGGYLKED